MCTGPAALSMYVTEQLIFLFDVRTWCINDCFGFLHSLAMPCTYCIVRRSIEFSHVGGKAVFRNYKTKQQTELRRYPYLVFFAYLDPYSVLFMYLS